MSLKKIALLLTLVVIVSSITIIVATEKKDGEDVTKTEISNEATNKGTLMFFMNPAGRPCQMQDNIIQKDSKNILKNVSLEYIKTTNTSDRQKFYTYGIRGLPSLILVDTKGKVIKRFAPGIRESSTILSEIDKLN